LTDSQNSLTDTFNTVHTRHHYHSDQLTIKAPTTSQTYVSILGVISKYLYLYLYLRVRYLSTC